MTTAPSAVNPVFGWGPADLPALRPQFGLAQGPRLPQRRAVFLLHFSLPPDDTKIV
jgi:hypothetical protein